MFDKILIANRGEIACRVIGTARRLGIATVAVYSDPDASALHVALADEGFRIGPVPARESYLNGSALIAAARRAGAQAIHPGYGFLSENAEFAESCAEAGIVFIGPPPAAIRSMGSKSAAKAIMGKAGVPLVPGYHGAAQDDSRLAKEADAIGYPVLIKAAAGGGGRGMRLVERKDGFQASLDSARREAKAAFSDDQMLLEKYLLRSRHIEMQVFADTHDNAVHLFERDCSIQRRHQKVVEEAPAPGLAPDRRRAMGEAAVAAARAIGYRGAGTVEFIVDSDGAFYFMEMNTRLQVEHPVTEMITGLDLVEWQIRVAAGEPLPLAQEAIEASGAAIEVRLYAEDPERGFLPGAGRLAYLAFPPASPNVRVDTGVRTGDVIGIDYDPMIAKLVVWDENREAAIGRLRAALAECAVVGPANNLAFLRRLAGQAEFAAAAVDTSFIARHLDGLVAQGAAASHQALAAATLHLLAEEEARSCLKSHGSSDPSSPWGLVDGWRLNGAAHHDFTFVDETGTDRHVRLDFHRGALSLELDKHRHDAAFTREDRDLVITLAGERFRATVVGIGASLTVIRRGSAERLEFRDPLAPPPAAAVAGVKVVAPMPGRVVAILVGEGARVLKGTALIALEAMKMEHTLVAPFEAVVASIRCAVDEIVVEGAELVTFEDAAEPVKEAAP